MNKYLYTITLLCTIFLLSSCDLDVKDPKNLSTSSYWKTEKDVWANLNTCYSSTVEGVGIYDEAYVDNVRCPYPWESNGASFKTNSLSAGDNEGYSFEAVRLCNVFIKNVETVEMDEALKKRMVAEARVLRAWAYMNLTLDFGKLPLITEPVDYNIASFERAPKEEVRQFVLNELDEAAKILPETYAGGFMKEKTRISKYAAISIKARAALYFGNYKVAEEAAKEVMQHGGYSLHQLGAIPADVDPEIEEIDRLVDYAALGLNRDRFLQGIYNYRSIWDKSSATADSPECIILKEYLSGDAAYADFTRYTPMRPDQMVFGWSSVVPMQNLVDAYWTAKGESFTPPSIADRAEAYKKLKSDYSAEMDASKRSFIAVANDWINSGKVYDYKYLNEFKNRDPRLYASIMFTFKRISDTDAGKDFVYHWRKGAKNESTTGFNFIKMVAKSTSTKLWGAYPASEANYPSFRYAEILLIFAEAHTQNVGYDAQVEMALNQLRDRVGMPHVASGLSKAEGLALVRNERRIELAGEGQRYQDIKRYDAEYVKKHMDNVAITQPDGDVVLTMQWDERMRLKPLPQQAIDLNPGLKNDQNPGY